ncbi:MAG: 2-isopropylmalate synthase [Lentisphaerae bacterium ADurb.Bin082]|nr:MAG: 2-isopropylmalate synthase [Lentisphaerae bacterium ADurb.Bin082]
MRKITIFDTTLRDGEQSPGCSMHITEKLEIAMAMERMRVDVIEAGFAVASQGDFEAVSKIAAQIKESTVCSLARAVVKDIDMAYEALKHAQSPRIHTFLATSPVHMEYKLKMTPEKVLQTIGDMVRYAKTKMSDIEFSAEDACRSERDFLVKAVSTAIEAGATVINIPDTVGYVTPIEMFDLITYLRNHVHGMENVALSVHCHNDLGLAVANSLAAARAGADQIECTINGLGERAGNAAMEEVVMGIQTRKDFYQCMTGIDTTRISTTSKLVYTTLGLPVPINKAIVGTNAFAHEAGIHQHGMLANRETYEIMTPQSIGLLQNQMVFGKHSGRHAIEKRLNEMGYELNKAELDDLMERFKQLADRKRSINDSDLEALVTKQTLYVENGYRLDRFTVNCGNYITSNAVVRLKDGEKLVEAVAIGDGPIDAAYKAIDMLIKAPPHILDDYTIFSVTEGNDALGEVIVRIKSGDKTVTGRGLSTDIIESSILAYINGLNRLL